jgi:hypothetical protein
MRQIALLASDSSHLPLLTVFKESGVTQKYGFEMRHVEGDALFLDLRFEHLPHLGVFVFQLDQMTAAAAIKLVSQTRLSGSATPFPLK